MLGLPEVQAGFARAFLGCDDPGLLDAIAEDGLPAGVRLDIHRNTVLASLTEALADAFPVVCRLLDERFFRYVAAEFIRAHPPAQACLSLYGAEFPEFLATFPPCRTLVYLPDIARLEWLMHWAAFAEDAEPLSPTALSGAIDVERLIFGLDPSLGLLSSPWPIDRIWRANRRGADGVEVIDLSSGGVHLEVRRLADAVVLRNLDAGTCVFRATLCRRSTLLRAAESALGADPGFDLARAVADLFRDGAVIAIAVEDNGA
jgi:hypothetical protein